MSNPGNLPDTADLARAPSGRRCERCPTVLSSYNPSALCWPCREREQMESLDTLRGGVPHEYSTGESAVRKRRARAVRATPEDDDAAEIARIRAEIRQVNELARARRERAPRRRGRLLARMRAGAEEP